MALFKRKKGKQERLLEEKPPTHKKHPQEKKGAKTRTKLIALVVIIVVAVVLYAYFVLQVNQVVVNSPQVVNITSAGNLYSINSNQYYISLAGVSPSTTTAYVHISKLPIFINPLLNVTLTLNNITKLNVGTNYSNIGMQLQSMGPSSVTVKISPLFPSLQIAPDSGKISSEWTTLSNSTSTSATKSVTTTSATTTIAAGATSVSTTQSTSTTISINQTAANLAIALKQYNLYGLMLNFSVLYSNTSNCNKALYNNAYFRYYSAMPNASMGADYVNQSQFVPYNLSSTTVNLGSSNFAVVYRTKTVSSVFNNQVALTINVSASQPASVTGVVFAHGGAFQGLSYSALKSSYQKAQTIGGACGIMVP